MSARPTPKKVIERFDRKGFLTESEFNVLRDELATTKRQRDAAVEALKLCYDHCLLYHPSVEHNNVGEEVRAVLREIEGKS